jgi:molybdenum cofactor synthesis domain-containing protein
MNQTAIPKKTYWKREREPVTAASPKTAAVLTISDSSYLGKREDISGPAIVRELEAAKFRVVHTSVLPDEKDAIAARMIECSELTRLIVTTGGTGIAMRDVTPEATLSIVERRIIGLEEKMRLEGAKKTPFAALSRGICGVRGKSLLLNLPGSPTAAVESLQAVIEILPHALELLDGKTEH